MTNTKPVSKFQGNEDILAIANLTAVFHGLINNKKKNEEKTVKVETPQGSDSEQGRGTPGAGAIVEVTIKLSDSDNDTAPAEPDNSARDEGDTDRPGG